MFYYILSVATVAFIIHFVYSWYIKPYFWVQYYLKQGGTGYFGFNTKWFSNNKENVKKHGNFWHYYMKELEKNPQTPFFVHNYGTRPILFITDPKLVPEAITKVDHKDDFTAYYFKEMERQGLSWIDGDDWKKKRKMVSSAFNFDFMNNFFKSLYRLTRQKFDDLAQTSNKASLTDFDLVSFSTVIAGENVSAFFYGEKHARMEVDGMLLTDLTVKLQQQFGSYHPSFWHQFVGPWFSKLKLTKLHREMMNNMELITEKGQRIIRALRESKDLDETSYLGVALKDGNMTDKELLDDFILTFMAGTDATAVSAARCMYYLWKHPECLAKVKKEVEEVFGDFKEESVKLESLKQMDYTLAFIKETLRMASPVAYFFPRECKKDTQIGDLKIHKGTLVTTPLNLTHQNADVFANPKEFIPERWMPDSEFAKKNTKINPNLYLPFGVGHRVCPGRQFSFVQLKMMIAFFIERFEWQFPENVREKMTWDVNFNYEPLEGYFPTLTKKK